jgi:hypothetical protein
MTFTEMEFLRVLQHIETSCNTLVFVAVLCFIVLLAIAIMVSEKGDNK